MCFFKKNKNKKNNKEFEGGITDNKLSNNASENNEVQNNEDNLVAIVPEGTTLIREYDYEGTNIKSIHVPSSVKEIDWCAFADCKKLEEVYLSEGLLKIGQSAFYRCEKLKKIRIPDSIEIIKSKVFFLCKNLVYNEFDNGLYLGNENNPYLVLIEVIDGTMTCFNINSHCKVIYENAFSKCELLEEIIIPEGVTSIGSYAFFSCKSLKKIVVPNSIKYVGCRPFPLHNYCVNDYENCRYLGNDINKYVICLGETRHYLDDSCYDDYCCSKLVINDKTKIISSFAFETLPKLEEVLIPDSVIQIAEGAFNLCENLKKINIPSEITSIEVGVFFGCTSLEQIDLPQNLIEIREDGFSRCPIDVIKIPNNVRYIGRYAFKDCTALIKVEMPNSVEEIDDYPFDGCISLCEVSYKGTADDFSKIKLGKGLYDYIPKVVVNIVDKHN